MLKNKITKIFIFLFLGALVAAAPLVIFNSDTISATSLIGLQIELIVLLGLGFLIGRNITKLIFERRSKVFGSKLKTRLVIAFGGLALVLSVVLLAFSGLLLNRAVSGWINSGLQDALNDGMQLAKFYAEEKRTEFLKEAKEDFAKIKISENLDPYRESLSYSGITLLDQDQTVISKSFSALGSIQNFSEPLPDRKAVQDACIGKERVLIEENESNKFIRAYLPIKKDPKSCVIVFTKILDPSLASYLQSVTDAYSGYRELVAAKLPIQLGYIGVLLLIALVSVFAAIWFGFYVAKQLTGPLVIVAAGARHVGEGFYERLPKRLQDDEAGQLVDSFNTMVDKLEESSLQVRDRQHIIETVLQKLGVGILIVDSGGNIIQANDIADRLLEIDTAKVHLFELFNKEFVLQIQFLLNQLKSGQVAEPIKIQNNILVTGASILNNRFAFLIEDITQIVKAEELTAFRKIAERVAHELKNPLTPIQLAADRIVSLTKDDEKIKNAAFSITENVSLMKKLMSDFTLHSALPKHASEKIDINELLKTIVENELPNFINISFLPDMENAFVMGDPVSLRQVFLNLFKNSVDSILEVQEVGFRGKIVVKTNIKDRFVVTSILDNGVGLKPDIAEKIFEPYVSSKKEAGKGTGLGLSIVQSIIEDHGGQVAIQAGSGGKGAEAVIRLKRA